MECLMTQHICITPSFHERSTNSHIKNMRTVISVTNEMNTNRRFANSTQSRLQGFSFLIQLWGERKGQLGENSRRAGEKTGQRKHVGIGKIICHVRSWRGRADVRAPSVRSLSKSWTSNMLKLSSWWTTNLPVQSTPLSGQWEETTQLRDYDVNRFQSSSCSQQWQQFLICARLSPSNRVELCD